MSPILGDAIHRAPATGLATNFGGTRFFANACGSTIKEYAGICRRFDDSPIDAIEISTSPAPT
jgi:hypothetical protein